jgi:hypothetical protein
MAGERDGIRVHRDEEETMMKRIHMRALGSSYASIS